MKKQRKRSKKEQEYALRLYQRTKLLNTLAKPGPHEFIVVLDHLKSDFNIGKIFRSADALGAHEIHLIGVDYFDPTPAKGSFKWMPARFYEHFSQCYEYLTGRGYSLFALETGANDKLAAVSFPQKSAFIFGHEEFGLSFDKRDYHAVKSLTIPQFGKVQSFNVSIAAAIVMYEYVRQHYLPKTALG